MAESFFTPISLQSCLGEKFGKICPKNWAIPSMGLRLRKSLSKLLIPVSI